jgi:tripartite-type tricarboxylate transporter receptor subunit TctC
VKSGRLRALGVTSAKRSAAAPDVPTLIEAGVPDYDYSTWYALFLPAATPRRDHRQAQPTTRKVLAADDIRIRFEARASSRGPARPPSSRPTCRSETEKVGQDRARRRDSQL